MARDSAGTLWLYRGTGNAQAPFAPRTRIGGGWQIYNQLVGAGDMTGDGHPDLPDGCLVAQTAMAIPVLSPAIAARATEALGFQRARLRTALKAAKLADCDADDFAVHIAAVNQSLAVMSRAGASRKQLGAIVDISMSALSQALRGQG